MKSTTNLTGALSSASNSMPLVDLPNAATTSSSRSEEQCGMAIPNPMPVLIVSSRCFSEARMGSRSSFLILPRLTSKSISSTMAAQRSVAFISGMICSTESKLANDMRIPGTGGEASGSVYVDKRDLPRCPYVASSHFLANLVIQSPGQQPSNAKHVDSGAQSAIAEAVLALAEATGPMVHRNFDQPIAGGFDQRGNETVHAFEWKQRAHALASHRFKSATGVAHPVFRVATADSICNPTRRTLDECVPALEAIAANKICTARNFGEQFRNVGRIIL